MDTETDKKNNENENEIEIENKNKIEKYNQKVKIIFDEMALNKNLTRKFRNSELPRYIFEWLLSKYSVDGKLLPEKERELFKLIENTIPDPEKVEIFKYQMMREFKEIMLLNSFRVWINTKSDSYMVYSPFFGGESRNITIGENIVKANKRMLYNHIWGIAKFKYTQIKNQPFEMIDFKPVQIRNVKLSEYIETREMFSLSEWVDLLINTMGLNPESFKDVKKKMYLIARLAPYVQNNFNLIEMGPKATGKSYLHKNISSHSHVIGGGVISRAQLFYNLRSSVKGLILTNDVVVFDDFSNIHINSGDEVIGKLKNFMADGIVDVGKYKERGKCSSVIMGNVLLNADSTPISPFYFKLLPKQMQESAFLDRITAFIPGWHLDPIGPDDLSSNYGLIGDWFSEILHEIRNKNFNADINQNIKFTGKNIRQRDIDLMRRTVSAYIKLLFPDGKITLDDWELLGQIAVDLRTRVIKQLSIIDLEYRDITLEYQVYQ